MFSKTLNNTWKKNKPVITFLSVLVLLQFLLKLGFYFYNRALPGNNAGAGFFPLIKWALLNDIFTVLAINAPFLLLLFLIGRFTKKKLPATVLCISFFVINAVCVLLNLVDIFYYHFHFQRADADLILAAGHSLKKALSASPWLTIFGVFVLWAMLMALGKAMGMLMKHHYHGTVAAPGSLAPFFLLLLVVTMPQGKKNLLPATPLIELNSGRLPFVQNSFHTMAYSLYRKREGEVHLTKYMGDAVAASLVPLKKNPLLPDSAAPKNIVLFIMESVPEDFFDKKGKHKVAMPFMDSLLGKSTYFEQAYSFSFTSTHGIVSILAGMPTLTDIPIYHSQYLGIPHTSIGHELAKKNYRSAFFIGDNYDDFGFAKCCNWLGIEKYYSRQDIAAPKKTGQHTMGLHDGDVLPFMLDEINKMGRPFFSVNYNISTHYPFDLPTGYQQQNSKENFTLPMKSMAYYSDCLKKFFETAAKQSWFNNTVFIFCADHWAFPNDKVLTAAEGQQFHIPIFIFDPSKPEKKTISSPRSQFDVMNTILGFAGINHPTTSYGNSLLADRKENTVFCRKNAGAYFAIDSAHILGFNIVAGKTEFCFNFRNDPERKQNLLNETSSTAIIKKLEEKVKAFIQVSSMHYNRLTHP
jgi:phosphoglycerol transferase MdoB-like AlkP superfamily enzyme